MQDENYQKLRDYALKLLSFRPRTNREIRGKLIQFSIKRGIPQRVVDQLLKELVTQKLINDREFVSWWIDQRDSFRPKGKKALIVELKSKGVADEIIKEVISLKKTDKDEYYLAEKIINRKLSLYKNLPRDTMKVKVGSLLYRRGFSWDTIYKVIDSIVKKS